MNTKIINVFAFAIGAAVGSVVTWKLVKTKYEQLANEEIESVKEVFANRKPTDEVIYEHSGDVVGTVESVEKDEDGVRFAINPKPTLSDYVKKLNEEGYSNPIDYAGIAKSEKEGGGESVNDYESMNKERPHVITPDEFGELDDYEIMSLTYYADGVLTNDWDEIIENVDDLVGEDSLLHFGEYEDRAVFVRNDQTQQDFEILRDERTFASVTSGYPPYRDEE